MLKYFQFFSEDEDMDSIVPKLWTDEKDREGKINWIGIAKSCVAELIGTMFLVLVGCGSCYNHSPKLTDFVR